MAIWHFWGQTLISCYIRFQTFMSSRETCCVLCVLKHCWSEIINIAFKGKDNKAYRALGWKSGNLEFAPNEIDTLCLWIIDTFWASVSLLDSVRVWNWRSFGVPWRLVWSSSHSFWNFNVLNKKCFLYDTLSLLVICRGLCKHLGLCLGLFQFGPSMIM